MMHMEKVRRIIFRKLTDADFFNINKPAGIESGGGGQSYIDISTTAVNSDQWAWFFTGIPTGRTSNGPKWEFEIHSLGVNRSQVITIGQRRNTTFSIRSQKLLSRESNRVLAWHPDHTNFPKPIDNTKREHVYDLVVYLVSLENGQYWAGWFQTSRPESDWPINNSLNDIFPKNEGIIENCADILFDPTDAIWPFRISVSRSRHTIEHELTIVPVKKKTEEELVKELFDEDENIDADTTPLQKEVIRRIRVRNYKSVKLLKELYGGKCQITGERMTFRTKDGSLYSEVHHLIPVGKGGSDSVFNLIVVSPLIHKMLHYANVSRIDLTKINNNRLTIEINGEEYTIVWHPNHAAIIENAVRGS